MKISYSSYSSFMQNPERWRLYYGLGLTPEGDETPSRMNLGRRRGACFHALYEHKDNAEAREKLIKQYGADMVKRCERLMSVVPDLGPLFLVEHSFEIPILDGKHSIRGRIDHGYVAPEGESGGDFKTSKGTRTKKEFAEYAAQMETSAQSHFYLKAMAALGHPTELFRYHIVLDAKDEKHIPTYVPLDLHVGACEVERTMAEVYAACETIEFLTNEYGIEKPWPHSNNWPCCGDKFFCGYAGLCGRTIPKGCVPPGYTSKYADLIQVEAAIG